MFSGLYPIPYLKSSPSGISLAVWQFFCLATGEVAVHAPDNGFKVIRLVGEERYCLGCRAVRWHDVLEGWHEQLAAVRPGEVNFRISRCRVCERLGEI